MVSHKCSLAFISALFLHLAATQSFNPTILQDSRDLPKVDGTFGFLYRTEDGIAHAAKGDSNGVIHGRFSYTDPTGLKVNYNYNAGSRVAPGYTYDDQPTDNGQYDPQKYQKQYQATDNGQHQPQKQYQPTPKPYQRHQQDYEAYRQPQYEEAPQPQYVEPKYVPQTRPPTSQQRPVSRPLYSSQYSAVENYPQRRTRPPYATHNEVYEDYN
ncbi:glutenin, low molecular weight subunit-like [Tribolium madens]|uniref:glutenin, low molecular weight subunit-like n=1 Tax=Tribolium madens TaxID=41895 RepID=UPI001CF72D00|nr:glutenin, low molecular weight subunit-like [Tribolium madens]